jgi:hypothetical protein
LHLTISAADGGGFRAPSYQPHKCFYKYKKLSVTHNPPLVSSTKLPAGIESIVDKSIIWFVFSTNVSCCFFVKGFF